MTHEEASLKTKETLAAALKRCMEKKPLGKITVSDLIREANVNRKTFYYHFEDISDLFQWLLHAEAVDVVKNYDLRTDYEQAILFVMDYIEKNSHILNCAYDSLGRENMKRFLKKDFLEAIGGVIDQVETTLGLSVSSDYKAFLTYFFTESFAALIIDWFKERDTRSRETTVHYLVTTMQTALPELLKHAPASI